MTVSVHNKLSRSNVKENRDSIGVLLKLSNIVGLLVELSRVPYAQHQQRRSISLAIIVTNIQLFQDKKKPNLSPLELTVV